jgi:hypothetical protein
MSCMGGSPTFFRFFPTQTFTLQKPAQPRLENFGEVSVVRFLDLPEWVHMNLARASFS